MSCSLVEQGVDFEVPLAWKPLSVSVDDEQEGDPWLPEAWRKWVVPVTQQEPHRQLTPLTPHFHSAGRRLQQSQSVAPLFSSVPPHGLHQLKVEEEEEGAPLPPPRGAGIEGSHAR